MVVGSIMDCAVGGLDEDPGGTSAARRGRGVHADTRPHVFSCLGIGGLRKIKSFSRHCCLLELN